MLTGGYLKELPQDPYSNGILKYKRQPPQPNQSPDRKGGGFINGGFILYSIGADFKDNNGEHDQKWGTQGGDHVFWPIN